MDRRINQMLIKKKKKPAYISYIILAYKTVKVLTRALADIPFTVGRPAHDRMLAAQLIDGTIIRVLLAAEAKPGQRDGAVPRAESVDAPS